MCIFIWILAKFVPFFSSRSQTKKYWTKLIIITTFVMMMTAEKKYIFFCMREIWVCFYVWHGGDPFLVRPAFNKKKKKTSMSSQHRKPWTETMSTSIITSFSPFFANFFWCAEIMKKKLYVHLFSFRFLPQTFFMWN